MCNRIDNSDMSWDEVEEALRAENVGVSEYVYPRASAFDRPKLPIVAEFNGRILTPAIWTLNQLKENDYPTKGINLQAENSHTYYRKVEHNRCVLPVSGFFDWQHFMNERGKEDTMLHRMHWDGLRQFYIACFYSHWDNGDMSFGMVTTEGNDLMKIVHNKVNKDPKRKNNRMPICLDAKAADRFLNDEPIENFTFPGYDPNLVAENLEPFKKPNTLFG
ncbi:SOS response-associated peptidase family protein [Chryseobacterium proteolyticum]|uniref:SOS response-associated peptidase family protein n=1 Tax=Chryseobacterium proteolyticum TaxID=118127 RepID=UPI0039834385